MDFGIYLGRGALLELVWTLLVAKRLRTLFMSRLVETARNAVSPAILPVKLAGVRVLIRKRLFITEFEGLLAGIDALLVHKFHD